MQCLFLFYVGDQGFPKDTKDFLDPVGKWEFVYRSVSFGAFVRLQYLEYKSVVTCEVCSCFK